MSARDRSVLIVEDEAPIRRFLRTSLEGHGFKVMEEIGGRAALELAAAKKPDLVLLDLGLPDLDGLEVLKRLREWSTVPVIILSARGKEGDKIAGLDSGADDYLTKPFGVKELLARVRVALRHAERAGEDPEPVYEHGDLKVDLPARRVWCGKKEVHLSPQQYELLAALVRNAGRVVGQEKLMRAVWPEGATGTAEALRILVHQIRHRIEKDPVRPKYLKTESGIGYRLESET